MNLYGDRPVYQQVADELRARICSGELAPGDRVPSEERLCLDKGVSRTTVRKAIEVLRAEGLVELRAPRGTFVRGGDLVRGREAVMMGPGDEAFFHDGTPVLRHADGNVLVLSPGTVLWA